MLRVGARVWPSLVEGQTESVPANPTASTLLSRKVSPFFSVRPTRGGGLAGHTLHRELVRARRTLSELIAGPQPSSIEALPGYYGDLGLVVSVAQAVLVSAGNALSSNVGGGVARPAAGYRRLQSEAMATLRTAGALFDQMNSTWSDLVHGGGSWTAQPVEVAPDRGDGRPLYHYVNTNKQPGPRSAAQRREYSQQLDRDFVDAGGKYEDMVTAEPGFAKALRPGVTYDFVMLPSGELRLWPRDREPAMGHALLAAGSELDDTPALFAGDLTAVFDDAGELLALMISTSSGHFLPRFEDASNTVPHLDALGVPADKLVFMGGPSELPGMLEELGSKGVAGAREHLPPTPSELLQEWDAPARPIQVALQQLSG